MQSIYFDPKIVRRQQWEQIWPTSILAIIAIIQMLLAFIIIGSETWNMILNAKYTFLFVGYNAAFFFTITWISTFTAGKDDEYLIMDKFSSCNFFFFCNSLLSSRISILCYTCISRKYSFSFCIMYFIIL